MVEDSKLLPQLQPIKFEHLQWLSVSGNNIESLECLTYLRCPRLTGLNADNNKIRSIRAMARINTAWNDINLSRLPITHATTSLLGFRI